MLKFEYKVMSRQTYRFGVKEYSVSEAVSRFRELIER